MTDVAMRTEPLFKAGDIAVLRNQLGGRIFYVHSVSDEKITEKAWTESQQPYALEVWCDELVAVRDYAAAQVLVKLLSAAHAKYAAEIDRLKTLRQQEFDALYMEYDYWRTNEHPRTNGATIRCPPHPTWHGH